MAYGADKPIANLIELKARLRRVSKINRRTVQFNADELKAGYLQLRSRAPSRTQGYLSSHRSGITSSGNSTNRTEEHLAIGLYQRGRLAFSNGERVELLDYQFPLKSKNADHGIGKIDLLGMTGDGTLVILELKTEDNLEDRRIGLIEGLIYAAIVEANIHQIAKEITAERRVRVNCAPPKLFLVAPPKFWTNELGYPSLGDFLGLVSEVARGIPIDISLVSLRDAELAQPGLNGEAPKVCGHAFLSYLTGPDQAKHPSRLQNETAYLEEIFRTFWAYKRNTFISAADIFDPRHVEGAGPPVFRAEHADRNLLVPPDAEADVITAIVGAIPRKERHDAFASMRSSQALAQSIFAGLSATGRLNSLERLEAEDGYPAFLTSSSGMKLKLEKKVVALNEPRPTSVDAFFYGARRIAVEVKFTEPEFGQCSRPQLTPKDKYYSRDYCDGNFTNQRNRISRCSLSERGIRYWEIIPSLFDWDGDADHRPCPLEPTYQLARNVMAASLIDDGTLDTNAGHVLVVYDERNPAFHCGGIADAQWWKTVSSLKYPRLLRRVSLQKMVTHLQQFPDFRWLTDGLRSKYGIVG